MTKCIALRLKKVLTHIINHDQKGFMTGRYIGDNIRTLLDIIDIVEDENLSGVILSIDFEKAFDTISWQFLMKCLHFFNFGPSFIQWIQTFFSGISSCILNTGWTTEFFDIHRGVRQGCPISPYLFLICAEILGIALRRTKDIKGFVYRGSETKLCQYADDTQIILDGSEESIRNTTVLLDKFSIISGLKVNYNKSELAPLGRSRIEIYKHNFSPGMKITLDKMKILGIVLPTNGNLSCLFEENFSVKRENTTGIMT